MRFYKNVIQSATLLTLGFCTPVFAGNADNWATLSDILTFGLPTVAAGMAWAQDDTEGGRQLGYSVGGAYAGSVVLKSAIYAPRPDGSDNQSFPSGHTAVAFAAVSFVDHRYGGSSPSLPWLYAAAGLAGVSRVMSDKHYFQDVVAGGALGFFSAHYLTGPIVGGQLSLLPKPGGLAVTWSRGW